MRALLVLALVAAAGVVLYQKFSRTEIETVPAAALPVDISTAAAGGGVLEAADMPRPYKPVDASDPQAQAEIARMQAELKANAERDAAEYLPASEFIRDTASVAPHMAPAEADELARKSLRDDVEDAAAEELD